MRQSDCADDGVPCPQLPRYPKISETTLEPLPGCGNKLLPPACGCGCAAGGCCCGFSSILSNPGGNGTLTGHVPGFLTPLESGGPNTRILPGGAVPGACVPCGC